MSIRQWVKRPTALQNPAAQPEVAVPCLAFPQTSATVGSSELMKALCPTRTPEGRYSVRFAYFLFVSGLSAAIGLATAGAAELKPATKQAPSKAPKATCGNHGTSVHFLATPSEAAKQALKEKKLVFVLHVSGIFEDPKLT
jgi:hypothetical protein